MGKFNFIKTSIEGVMVIEPTVFGDSRGHFFESYNYEEFKENGMDMVFVQDNQSKSTQGVLRGLHYQTKKPQGKLVRVIKGEVFDVAVDIRENSPTYGKWEGIILSEENKKMFYVPEGFAHGFLVLSEEAEFVYKCTNFYDPTSEAGIMWDDKTINIDWPISKDMKVKLSEKDLRNKTLNSKKDD